MTPVIAPKIKKESLLISSDHFGDSHIANFVLCWQLHRSVNIQFRGCGWLATVARNEASTNII